MTDRDITPEQRRKLLGALGLCAGAGRLVYGTDAVCSALGKNRDGVFAVAAASDISENTRKRLSDKCAYYGVKLADTGCTMDELSHATGKSAPISAVALTDKNLCKLFLSALSDGEKR